MNLTIIGASDEYARSLASWAVDAGHQVTIVGFNLGQAKELVKSIGARSAAGPSHPLRDKVIFLAMPYNCVLDARDFYGKQLNGKIVIDVTTPIDPDSFEPIHPGAGSVAQEIVKAALGARVVKVFHPNFAGMLVADQNPDQETIAVLMAGDDAEAKSIVAELFQAGGLRPIDVGPLQRARDLEAIGYRHAAQRLSSKPVGRTR